MSEIEDIPEDIDQIASAIVKNPYAGDDEPDFQLYLAIARAIQAERNRSTWQPIESAPKDGTDILITTEGYGMLVRIGFYDAARDGVWSIWPGRDRMNPTHWQPLPSPPNPSSIKREK